MHTHTHTYKHNTDYTHCWTNLKHIHTHRGSGHGHGAMDSNARSVAKNQNKARRCQQLHTGTHKDRQPEQCMYIPQAYTLTYTHTYTQLSCTQRTHSAVAAPKIKQRQKVCNTQFLILNGCRGSPMGWMGRGIGGLANAVDSAAVAYSQLTGLKCTSAPHTHSTR